MEINTLKAGLAALVVVCMTVLLATNRVSEAVAMPIITAVAFYAIGNGIAAARGKTSTPLIRPRWTAENNPGRRETDSTD